MSTDRTKFYLDVLSGHEVEIHCSSFVRRNHSNQKSNVLLDLVKLVRTQSYDKVRLSSVIKHNRTHGSPKKILVIKPNQTLIRFDGLSCHIFD